MGYLYNSKTTNYFISLLMESHIFTKKDHIKANLSTETHISKLEINT